ncbi:trypsin-like peptidase domain-containing protein [Rhizobacter sp. OV335]|uniref:trypsin-like peptidase domain-containing protein n=1 Tax=Rhizobacter sp. OV335 TaxID=1500264 RepID=UPI00116128DA|nr:trypsin-like peptidase domain-containing protein [Rhizobacter sp. OV335]
MLNNVVLVEADAEHGLGFIIGRVGDVLWIATAAHVVFPHRNRTPPQPASRIQVQVRGVPTWFSPEQPPDPASNDIAFIGVRAPLAQMTTALFWRSNVQVNELTPGQSLRIAGMPGLIAYSPSGTGKVSGTPQFPVIEIAAGMGQSGQSGGPVASAEGFVGMYQKSEGDRVVSIGIVRKAALNAGRPWELLPAPLPNVAVRLCLTAAAESMALPDINGPGGTVKRDAANCVNTMSGINTLVSPQLFVLCDPPQVNLPREPQQHLAVRCYVDPSGAWMSKTDGYAMVAARGGIWTIEGLSQSKFGAFTGLLIGTPPTLQAQMRTLSGSVATGNLTLAPRRLQGVLLVDGQSFSLDMER